jgi:hypothetical protein
MFLLHPIGELAWPVHSGDTDNRLGRVTLLRRCSADPHRSSSSFITSTRSLHYSSGVAVEAIVQVAFLKRRIPLHR